MFDFFPVSIIYCKQYCLFGVTLSFYAFAIVDLRLLLQQSIAAAGIHRLSSYYSVDIYAFIEHIFSCWQTADEEVVKSVFDTWRQYQQQQQIIKHFMRQLLYKMLKNDDDDVKMWNTFRLYVPGIVPYLSFNR